MDIIKGILLEDKECTEVREGGREGGNLKVRRKLDFPLMKTLDSFCMCVYVDLFLCVSQTRYTQLLVEQKNNHKKIIHILILFFPAYIGHKCYQIILQSP